MSLPKIPERLPPDFTSFKGSLASRVQEPNFFCGWRINYGIMVNGRQPARSLEKVPDEKLIYNKEWPYPRVCDTKLHAPHRAAERIVGARGKYKK